MNDFQAVYSRLNTGQKQAVDAIDGPVLVIAGPGTGKTQLLSARVANILSRTDTPAQNILCLTFTESGAQNMRERLTRFIGQTAYDVNIGTYHAFGGDLIRRYPEYFAATRLQEPVDELGQRQILVDIIEHMSFNNPLRQTRHHLGDLKTTISEVKRALLTPEDLRAIASENLAFITAMSGPLQEIFDGVARMPSKVEKSAPYFERVLLAINAHIPAAADLGSAKEGNSYTGEASNGQAAAARPVYDKFGTLAGLAAETLAQALTDATETGKTTPLTTWKNDWLAKDTENHFVIDGRLANNRIRALATLLDQYTSALEEQGLYDFDDMILRSIAAMEEHPDFRYTLQEKYLYVLLDEFQDTNAAQLRLIQLLTDNPVNEGRPNVMAVGDDDQAIYAFQGAQYSNMLDFYTMYRDVLVVNLTQNYRSKAAILETAQNISAQITNRLHESLENVSKTLEAANPDLPNAIVERVEFLSPIAERDWIARRIKSLIDDGTAPSDIAVLAPKHKHLEPLVPYLNHYGIPVRYEKRENILESPVVRELLTMCRLVLAIEQDNQPLADHLWPQVLSYDFWQLPTAAIWRLSWQVSDARKEGSSWSKLLLENAAFRPAALLLMHVASRVHTETAETLLDLLIGNAAAETHEADLPMVTSPLRDYYTGAEVQAANPDLFYETVSHLTVLRSKLLDHQRSGDKALTLHDFMRFVGLYEEAEQQMINTSPYSQQTDSVQLMTVYKAKGLEYAHVFLPSMQDDVWGSSATSSSNKLTLPANLAPIRHAGASEDERLRILFVALTRARYGLHLTSAIQNYNGKPAKRLKYLDEREQPDNTFRALVLPEGAQLVQSEDASPPELRLLEIDWRARHLAGISQSSLRGLLSDRLERYQLSPTHVTDFINLEYAGPQKFYFKSLLKFPEAQVSDAQFGTAIHETLEWVQHRTADTGNVPGTSDTIAYFRGRMSSKQLSPHLIQHEMERGERALSSWMRQRSHIIRPADKAEVNFYNEGVFVGEAHMTGQVDRLEIDQHNKTITVVDYKTGNPASTWKNESKLHRYRLQLCLYKLLIEGSTTYKDYTVSRGRLEYIEPDEQLKAHQLELQFTDDDMDRARGLVEALWKHVHALDFPDTSKYPATPAGIRQFEQDLLDGTI